MRKVLIYTVHKAASMFLHRLTSEVANELKTDYYSINDSKYHDIIDRESWRSFIEAEANTGCFGPIRAGEAEPSIPADLELYSIILHLRDPRDVLTSLFFSHTYSHPVRAGLFNPTDEQRKQWEEEGIDKFVIGRALDFKQRYQELCSNLLGKENVVLLKYENMVSNYGKWLERFLSAFSHFPPPSMKFFSIDISPNTVSRIHKKLYRKHKNEFGVSSENIYEAKRQVSPGDHKRKLSSQSIEKLNDEFRNLLILLKYDD